jgi:hypothetical protein
MLLNDGVLDDAVLSDLGLDPMFTAQALLDDDGITVSPQYIGVVGTSEMYPAQIVIGY